MLFKTLALTATYASTVLSAVIPLPTAVVNSNQIITGITEKDVETFKGIPFAAPPLGDLRFKKPADYTGTYQGLAASDFRGACMQLNPEKLLTVLNNVIQIGSLIPNYIQSPLYDLVQGSIAMSEDCLYLNIYRPKGTKPTDKLPVMAWIYGGAFLFGSTATYPGSKYVQESVAMGQPVVFVSISYRLGPYGFLGGSALKSEGNTNAGLHDQRKALEWIQDHIADFGGDPTKVMIFGESAGAMSVAHQLAAYGGNNLYNGNPLFTSAILQSGGPLPFADVESSNPDKEYTRFVSKCGCSGLADAATLTCLRSKSSDVLADAFNSYPLAELYGILPMFLGYGPRPDGDILPDSAYNLYNQNKVAQVPLISGNMEDEGTMFAFTMFNSSTTADVKKWLKYVMPTASDTSLNNVLTYYTSSITAGAPFRTGLLNALTPQFKRIGALLNDLLFTAPRRTVMQNSTQKRYNYLATHLHNIVPVLGTFHASDVLFQYFIDNTAPSNAFRRYFVSFANNHDPNIGTNLATWNPYTTSDKNTLEITLLTQFMRKDDYRTESTNYFMTTSDLVG